MVFLDTPLVVASKSHQGVLHDVLHDVPHNVPLEFCMSVIGTHDDTRRGSHNVVDGVVD